MLEALASAPIAFRSPHRHFLQKGQMLRLDQPLFLNDRRLYFSKKPVGNFEEQNYYSEILEGHIVRSLVKRERERTDLGSAFIKVQRWGV